MHQKILDKNVDVISPTNLYKWAKVWGKVQKSYYSESVYLRREKQIEDFVKLNEFINLYVEKDTDILKNLKSVDSPDQADLIIITDQKFSRLPCVSIIEKIESLLDKCPRMFVCLNRHYINIDNSYTDPTLDDHFPLAITQWLKKNLKDVTLLDLSLDYLDCGDWFTWVVPDRMYFLERR
jgi:hypothetical protein